MRTSQIGAGWSSPVARQAHNLKVTGSNPVPATIILQMKSMRWPASAGFSICSQTFPRIPSKSVIFQSVGLIPAIVTIQCKILLGPMGTKGTKSRWRFAPLFSVSWQQFGASGASRLIASYRRTLATRHCITPRSVPPTVGLQVGWYVALDATTGRRNGESRLLAHTQYTKWLPCWRRPEWRTLTPRSSCPTIRPRRFHLPRPVGQASEEETGWYRDTGALPLSRASEEKDGFVKGSNGFRSRRPASMRVHPSSSQARDGHQEASYAFRAAIDD